MKGFHDDLVEVHRFIDCIIRMLNQECTILLNQLTKEII